VIGGGIDALDYGFQTYEAVGEYDYGKAVGRGMQTGGAAASVCGSALALVATFGEAGSALGPIGTLFGLAGGALVATGHLVAKWLQLNANEAFAVRSFLGDDHAKEGKEVSWSKERLPTNIPKKEALVLTDMLAQFRVSGGSLDADWNDWAIEIVPGYYEAGSRFEVDIVNSWDTEAAQALVRASPTAGEPGCNPVLLLPEPVHVRVVVDLEEGEVRQLEAPMLKAAKVRFDGEGRVESVLINLEEQESMKPPPEEEGPLNLEDVARLLAGPPRGSLLRTNAYRVTRVKLRLVRPEIMEPAPSGTKAVSEVVPQTPGNDQSEAFRYVPKGEGQAVQVVLPMVGPMSSLDVKEGEPMDVWAESVAPTEEGE
jgi:hypothetical protein